MKGGYSGPFLKSPVRKDMGAPIKTWTLLYSREKMQIHGRVYWAVTPTLFMKQMISFMLFADQQDYLAAHPISGV